MRSDKVVRVSEVNRDFVAEMAKKEDCSARAMLDKIIRDFKTKQEKKK